MYATTVTTHPVTNIAEVFQIILILEMIRDN